MLTCKATVVQKSPEVAVHHRKRADLQNGCLQNSCVQNNRSEKRSLANCARQLLVFWLYYQHIALHVANQKR